MADVHHHDVLAEPVLIGFQKKWRHQHLIRRIRFRQIVFQAFGNAGVQQGLQPLAFAVIVEDTFAQRSPVQGAVLLKNGIAKVVPDGFQCRFAGLNHLAGYIVRVNHEDAVLTEEIGHGTLAAANASGQANHKHVRPSSRTATDPAVPAHTRVRSRPPRRGRGRRGSEYCDHAHVWQSSQCPPRPPQGWRAE